MDKQEKLKKAEQVKEMRKNGDSVATIIKAMNITYADYKKLETLIDNNPTKYDDEFWKLARISAEQCTKEELVELYLAEVETAVDCENQIKSLKRGMEIYQKERTNQSKELRRKDKEISSLKQQLAELKGDKE